MLSLTHGPCCCLLSDKLHKLEKVKAQMRQKMREEILRDSKFGSGNHLADRIGRGATHVVCVGIFAMLLAVVPLAAPPGQCGEHVGGASGCGISAAGPPSPRLHSDRRTLGSPRCLAGGLQDRGGTPSPAHHVGIPT